VRTGIVSGLIEATVCVGRVRGLDSIVESVIEPRPAQRYNIWVTGTIFFDLRSQANHEISDSQHRPAARCLYRLEDGKVTGRGPQRLAACAADEIRGNGR
jgi:hypothetical protein